MLEILHVAGGYKGEYFPDSGPGNKYLMAGDENIGYFGEVSSSALITHAALKTHLGLSTGTVGPDVGWFKFFHKGLVKFVAKKACFSNLTWDALYAAGGVYGTNDNGVFPATTPKNQYKPFLVPDGEKICTLVPRLISGALNDPTGLSAAEITDYGSELSDLLYRIVSGSHANAGAFAQYVQSDVTMQVKHTCMETNRDDTSKMLIRVYNGINANGYTLRKNDPSGYSQYCRMVLALESSV